MHPLADLPRSRALGTSEKSSGEAKGQKSGAAKSQYKKQLEMALGKGRDDEGGPPPSQKPEFPEDSDPINYLGYGMVSYFMLVKLLVKIFFVLTLLNIPTVYFYASYNGFTGLATS